MPGASRHPRSTVSSGGQSNQLTVVGIIPDSSVPEAVDSCCVKFDHKIVA